MSYQRKLRIGMAREFGRMLMIMDDMPTESQTRIRESAQQLPTHHDIADDEEAIRAIAEEFWPDMKEDE